MRIGFLLNHEGAHQVGHVVPIASALAAASPQVDVDIFVAGGTAEAEVRRSVGSASHRISIVRLKGAGWFGQAVTALSGGAVPAKRISTLRRNRASFASLDALVVPEKTSLMLKSRFGLRHLPLIHTRHGAGDRAVGFDRASGRFDLVLLAGNKIRDRLEEADLLKEDGFAVVGYPKFDRLDLNTPASLFGNGRPTVLYNPHPSPALSSWYKMGPQVLDYFARQRKFNLIFAPHVMLFGKRYQLSLDPPSFGKVAPVPDHVRKLSHIHVDLGSSASVDMTYTRAADIYLGDVSSQVYEFLAHPRPCIFLNPQGLEWEGDPNFAHWIAGPVISDLAGIGHAVETAAEQHHAYRGSQQKLFDYTFDLQDEPSAARAARAIVEWLQRRPE